MKLIYTTQKHKSNKYNRYQSEYFQNGNRVEKYTTSWTKNPGRLEKDESRVSEVRYLSSAWDIDDPNMPQWLKKYLINDAELSLDEQVSKLKNEGFRVYLWSDDNLIIFKNRTVKVFSESVWVDIIPLIKLYYGRKNTNDRLISMFENDWLDQKISYQKLLDREQEINQAKSQAEYDEKYQRFLAKEYDSNASTNRLIDLLKYLISVSNKSDKEFFVNLLEQVMQTEPSHESYAAFMTTIFLYKS